MDLYDIARKLGFSESKPLLLQKAQELHRLCDVHFDSSIIEIGEVCKGIICFEIAATRMQVLFDRQNAIKLSGMSEKAYNRSFNALQNSLGVRTKLDIREWGIQFGCVKLIPSVQKGLSLMQVLFDRQNAIKLSGMSEKAYNKSFNALQNSLGVRTKLDIREWGIQFGCVKLIPSVQKGLSL